MNSDNLQKALYFQISELSQNLMLVGYESNSSRISHDNGDMSFRGFSGSVLVTKQGELTVSEKGVALFSSKQAQVGVDQGLIDRLKRINQELMDIYEQQVLSGD